MDESFGDFFFAFGVRGWICESGKDKEGDSVVLGF